MEQRLIDANALMEKMKHRWERFGRESDCICLIEDAPTIEAVPLSWWNELKDFLKSWKDDPWEKITTSAIAELVLNKMNFIEEKGTEKQCF